MVISKHIEENKGFLHNYTKLHLVHIAAFSVFGSVKQDRLGLFQHPVAELDQCGSVIQGTYCAPGSWTKVSQVWKKKEKKKKGPN